MAQHSYRRAQYLPRRGPRAAHAFHVTRRDGLFLATDTVPFQWSAHNALAFRSREAAAAFVRERLASAVKPLGLRVVAA